MDADQPDHVIATYREIAAHFRLKGPVQARVKAKRAGWPSEPQNHPADPLRIRVPRDVWNARFRDNAVPLPHPPRPPRNPLSPIPDLKDEIGGIIKGFETALETVRQQQAALQRQMDRERERADQAEAEREAARAEAAAERARAVQAEREREAAKVAAAAAEGEAKGLRLALEEARRPFWRRWLGP